MPDEPVVIVEPDPGWPERFEAERRRVAEALGPLLVDVEHVGSTAVPGLAAKPVIDVMVGVASLGDTPAMVEALEGLGYEYLPELEAEMPARRYFRRVEDGRRTAQVHLVERSDVGFWSRHVRFRDHLRAFPEDRDAYARLKRELAERHRDDRGAYTEAKTAFIRDVEQRSAIEANRRRWDERVAIHLASRTYDLEAFRAGADPLLHPWLLDELGDVHGLDLVHLQCHFGMDTLGLARRGARVTGLDFSAPAVDAARGLAAELGLDARFVCADLYDAAEALSATYDVVFTGIGALMWLPDIRRWAEVVGRLLRPGGSLYLAEFHPVLLALDLEQLRPRFAYLEPPRPDSYDEPRTYTDADAPTAHNEGHEWNHGLGEVVTALLDAGLHLEFLHERTEVEFKLRDYLVERRPGVWAMPDGELPLLLSLRARKPH